MAGHSKWNNIKRKKEATDSARAKIFTKIGREFMVCVKEGGADPNSNTKLRELIAKAKSNNVPNDNIERMLKKAAGGDDKASYEANIYEGYGPSGVAVIVEALTDNKNRTAGDMRHYFDKYGGNLGNTGCVSFMFTRKGIIIIENTGLDEDKFIDDVTDSGALDYTIDDEYAEVETEPNDVNAVRESLEGKGYKILSAEAEMLPATYVALTDEEAIKKMNLLLEHLEDNDDVQRVYHNWDEEV
ncbi:MAG: YebC/PmpR family DNA-binding transcriptional regulator [Oscillospiraceae bacterium]|nr:YebC/PmpR family DNA-binding transcriptional regulator [Oscillospiraceae bacterium]